jgi:hypothetical protein
MLLLLCAITKGTRKQTFWLKVMNLSHIESNSSLLKKLLLRVVPRAVSMKIRVMAMHMAGRLQTVRVQGSYDKM